MYRLFTPGPRHLEIAFELLGEAGAGGNLTTDAQIAALAIEYLATFRWRIALRNPSSGSLGFFLNDLAPAGTDSPADSNLESAGLSIFPGACKTPSESTLRVEAGRSGRPMLLRGLASSEYLEWWEHRRAHPRRL